MRACTCERFVTGQPWRKGRDCWLCWQYHNDPAYKKAWDGSHSASSTAPPPTPADLQRRTFTQRLVAFSLAMTRETTWRASGGLPPTPDEKATRRALCNTCPARDASDDSCTICGCYLESGLMPPRPLGKLDCATQQCPKSLWGPLGGYKPTRTCGG